jgi:alkanesulfonate monooxygenase SsuD/methylene tetrahydromethanopterin reductase-like flavin-dependent oxidoreductase (luciferase family)
VQHPQGDLHRLLIGAVPGPGGEADRLGGREVAHLDQALGRRPGQRQQADAEPGPGGGFVLQGPSNALNAVRTIGQGRGEPAATYRNAQELFVGDDELGFDMGWVAQHHAPLGGGGLPSPWTFLSHAAARTKRIRLSTAITVLPLENPVRLAEDVSVADLLSGGRVEIGVGSGGSELEYAASGRDVARKRELTSEGLEVLRNALANREVGPTGFTIQPPAGEFTGRIWQGMFSGPGAEYAAKGGSNLLLNRAAYGYDAPTDEVQRPWADAYLRAWDQPRAPRIGLSRFVFPAKDRKTALVFPAPNCGAVCSRTCGCARRT